MATSKSHETGTTPLKLAELITKMANKEWQECTFIEKVSPITKDLLRFWDTDGSFAEVETLIFTRGNGKQF